MLFCSRYALLLAFTQQCQHFLLHLLLAGDATWKALTRQRRELDFDHIEPRSALGRVVKLEALSQSKGFLGLKGFVERADVVGIEIVLHQTYPDLS